MSKSYYCRIADTHTKNPWEHIDADDPYHAVRIFMEENDILTYEYAETVIQVRRHGKYKVTALLEYAVKRL